MSNYADFIDLLASVQTKQWSTGRWTAWVPGNALGHNAPTGAGVTEKEAISRLLDDLDQKEIGK